MIVGDLLELDDLHMEVAWATQDTLDREVTGVTSTDLQDPSRYLQRGELVLTGLVWWRPEDGKAAMRFANSLRTAQVAALLAGEGTHGSVPAELVDACRRHGVPLLSIPAGTSFRAVTDRIYLRLWGDLQTRAEGRPTLPAAARQALTQMIHTREPLAELLRRAVADLGLPACSLTTGGGRLLATSTTNGAPSPAAVAPVAPLAQRPGAHPGTARSRATPIPVGPPGDSPFDGWQLRPHAEPGPTAEPLLHGLAELLAPLAGRARATTSAQAQTGARLIELLDAGDDAEAQRALGLSGLPPHQPLVPVAAQIAGAPGAWTAAALADALHETGAPFISAPGRQGRAMALAAAPEATVVAVLREALPRLESRLNGDQRLRLAVGPTADPQAAGLRSALTQARFAVHTEPPGTVGRSTEISSLRALLRGIPREVTTAFHERVLAPLIEHDRANPLSLLDTLDTFLRHSASWAQTAEALHIHVNTVHYRIRRIEALTGRSLQSLDDRLDLLAALRCAPGRGSGSGDRDDVPRGTPPGAP